MQSYILFKDGKLYINGRYIQVIKDSNATFAIKTMFNFLRAVGLRPKMYEHHVVSGINDVLAGKQDECKFELESIVD